MRGWSWIAGFASLALGLGLAGCASRADHEACRRQLIESRDELTRLQAEDARLKKHLEELKRSLSADELLACFQGKLVALEAMLGDRNGRPAKTGAEGLDREKLLDLTSQMQLLIRMISDILPRAMDDGDANERPRSEGR